MFRFKSVGEMRGDCTSSYLVELDGLYTIQKFIQEVLLFKSGEWGYFGIHDGKTIFGNPSCEYRYGSLISNFPAEFLSKPIISCTADGGWSRMDYKFTI